MSFVLSHYGYSGVSWTLATGELAEVRRLAGKVLKLRRKWDYDVSVIERGREWETTEPDSMSMVPDNAGILRIWEYPYPIEDEDEDVENEDEDEE